MLYIVGLGLGSTKDITVRGLETLKTCDHIYVESYTSAMADCASGIRELTHKEVHFADREMVESGTEILNKSSSQNVAFVVIGDPLGATTHTDLILRAVQSGISYEVIHNASIMTAVGCCGVQLYNFGATVSIPFWDEFGRPESFYDKIMDNITRGLHTLCLLDIKVKERSLENILKERMIYEPPRFMTCGQAVNQLLQIIGRKGTGNEPRLTEDCLAIGMARIGRPDQCVIVSTLREFNRCFEMSDMELNETTIGTALGGPLHSLVIPGDLHAMEEEFLAARYKCVPCCSHFLPRFFLTANQEASPDLLDKVKESFLYHKNLIRLLNPCKM
ncbi:Diphthine methyl ester synthase [Fasciola gigantica]|uniref:diphthine methyl ester synthase n=1 Tax=Fasciola gigantica TaxID=46835 RepID=A0A504YA78_FASGI|nr:Diphthine methyl ester synthase [Fasciola gigantica]